MRDEKKSPGEENMGTRAILSCVILGSFHFRACSQSVSLSLFLTLSLAHFGAEFFSPSARRSFRSNEIRAPIISLRETPVMDIG